MDLIACEEKIDSYLFTYGFEEKSETDKERLKRLKKVIEHEKLNLDLCDYNRAQNKMSAEEFLKQRGIYSVNAMKARGYMEDLKRIILEMKEEEKEARRDEFKQKVRKIGNIISGKK